MDRHAETDWPGEPTLTTMTPLPTQLSGARFLASERHALLADEPRCGKTGAAILACDLTLAERILVVTTASGRGVWLRGFADWSVFDRDTAVIRTDRPKATDVTIVGWPNLTNPKVAAALLQNDWDVLVLDEDHFAKSFDAKRTQAVYGVLKDGGQHLDNLRALYARAKRVWPLTGTPMPHSPADMYVRLRALAPSRLAADPAKGWPDVTEQEDFLTRYTIRKPKKLSQFNTIMVVIGGRNLEELRERLRGFMLLRTQQDVGIRAPIYDTLPFVVSAKERAMADGDADRKAILDAAGTGDTRSLEIHLGPLRRITGEIKASHVVDAVKDEFASGLDKIVLAYWHKNVGAALLDGLSKFGVTGIDGSTPAAQRQKNVDAFSKPNGPRVFLAQIEAAGEAIDLSAAAELWFVETAMSPKSMKQMSLRVTNYNQHRQAVVRVCTLAGSIDEALQASLMRLWAAIREVLK